MSQEPPTQRAEMPTPARQAGQRVTDLLATLLGIGMIVAGGLALADQWPVGTGLMLFIAGGALLPFVRVPGRGSRAVIVVLAFGVAMVTPLWSSFVVHRQVQGTYRYATDAAARLTEMAVKDGRWPSAAAGFPDKLEPVYRGAYSRDLEIKDCGGKSCTLIVTLTDHDYDTSIRSRHFALWTRDGGKTWACGPTKLYPLAPKDLPEPCQSTGSR